MTGSLLSGSTSATVSRGRVKITFARVDGSKQLAGSCSDSIENSTPQESLAYVQRACQRDAILETISEASGVSVDDLLSQLQNEHAPAPEDAEGDE